MTRIEEFVKEQAEKHGRERSSLMPILQAVVQSERFLSEEAMVAIATELDLSTADVFGTASFYTFLDTVPRGKNIIRVCKTITCHMKGKDAIIATLEDMLKVKLGETTSDGKFSLLQANCLGWCHKGPVMLVNDEIYPEVTPEKAVEIIREYLKKTK
ncbi:MAG: NAD(P)H-dependent oxidoreductase subunit E [Bacteroidales bacterium]|jgi:NADH:ubiquinone oxidoreductase subunit E|nr:NAD(P)H-dependent oxidoreductase subunit E [Bacteroidales bacterium]NLM91713.1 NAD(P)H-dependent oxidoreductase subunit E [Bacteroidales bacterium]